MWAGVFDLAVFSEILSLLPYLLGGDVPEADDEAVPMAPLRQRRSQLSDDDDGLCSEIREEELMEIRRKYSIPPSVELRCPTEFERAPDGGICEIAIFEAHLEAGFRGGIHSLIAEISAYFFFAPSQLTPMTWRMLIAIQVL